jgi:beta-barrel assembly-enhancing protease
MRQINTSKSRLIIAVVIALVSVVSYFSAKSTNDITGEVQHVRISPEDEVALGLQAAPEMAQQFGGVVKHPVVTRYVEGVGGRVLQRSKAGTADEYKFNFHVLADDQTVNAFALPGGQVFITVGLLRRLTNEAQLAGVLGHEVGHVVARHGAEHLAKAQLTQGLVGAVGVGMSDPDNPRSGQQAAAMAAAIGHLVNLKYGRSDELESDRLGVQFMADAGYDPRGMIGLMKVLSEASGGRGGQPEFFATHPNPENRIARLEEMIREETEGKPAGETGEDRFAENVLKYVPR